MKTITSVNHPIIKHIVKLRQNRDYRYDQERVVVEGVKPIEELCKKTRFSLIATYNEAMIPIGAEADEIILLNDATMKKASGMESPEGLLAELPMPKPASLEKAKYILVFDGVNDPGNVGAMLRTALALGWEGAYFLNDSCDPFNEKALRAARGATFRLPLAWGGWDTIKELAKKKKLKPLVADVEGQDLSNISATGGVMLVMGNEARGPSAEAKAFCERISIAMPGAMESLNVSVAAGILMHALVSGRK
jgi:TrmH family RNA methyltransferase